MKTLVIGGSGFIGSHLIHQLLPHQAVVNLDKSPSLHHSSITSIVDIRDKKSLMAHTPDGVSSIVHLAAEHRDDVSPFSLYYDVNVEGTRNIIDVAIERNIKKIVFTSSVAVYGLNRQSASEETVAKPFNHYGKSKLQAEELLVRWQNEDPANRSLVVVRPTVVFGPGNKGNVHNLLQQILSGKFMMIGRGNNKKSLSYIDNVCGFIEYCLGPSFQGYQLFNYVDSPDYSMNELVDLVDSYLHKKTLPVRIPFIAGYAAGKLVDGFSLLTGKKYPVSSVRIKKFCSTTQFSAKKMMESGYIPQVALRDGLHATLDSISKVVSHASKVTVLSPFSYKVKEAQ